MRDIRSALAFVLTSGRNCNQIHDLYVAGTASEVLAGFYFNSWTAPGTADRLLNAMSRVDMAAAADPELDRRLDYVGPDGGRALMTVDQRGDYDARLLATMAAELPRGAAVDGAVVTAHREYLSAARRRFYFECIDDERARQMLPYRSAQDFADLLDRPESIASRLPDVISALNRGEGIEQTAALDGALALQVRRCRRRRSAATGCSPPPT